MTIGSNNPSTTNHCHSDVDILAIVREHLELVPGVPGVVVFVLGHCSGDVKHHVLIIEYLLRVII